MVVGEGGWRTEGGWRPGGGSGGRWVGRPWYRGGGGLIAGIRGRAVDGQEAVVGGGGLVGSTIESSCRQCYRVFLYKDKKVKKISYNK